MGNLSNEVIDRHHFPRDAVFLLAAEGANKTKGNPAMKVFVVKARKFGFVMGRVSPRLHSSSILASFTDPLELKEQRGPFTSRVIFQRHGIPVFVQTDPCVRERPAVMR